MKPPTTAPLRTLAFALALLLVCWQRTAGAESAGLIRIAGPIGPATASYIARALEEAAQQGDVCAIIQLDTPGGLLESTKDIVQAIYATTVPVVVFVAPAGATAASAGCFITLAADVAAMAPGTSIGAAHPVTLGGGGGGEAKPDPVMQKKLENFAATFIESIAARRGRNVEWAKSSVRESAAITAEQALELKVIEIAARDVPDLLAQLDGRPVKGKALRTAGATVREMPMLARERVFQQLWRPEVMFILLLIAIYGIIGELSNPGAVFPGVIGAIALILALYMSAILPVNFAGLALMALGAGLFVAEAVTPTHGPLTLGGIACFFLGAFFLFGRAEPFFRLSLTLIIPATLITAAFFILVIGAGLRAQHIPIRTGREAMIGQTARALSAISAEGGTVFVEGEYWRAQSDALIAEGAPAEVTGVEGLSLKVKPKKPEA